MTDKKGTGAQQPQDQKFTVPMAQDPAKAALEAAAKAAHEAALQAFANINPQPDPQPEATTPPRARGALRINTRSTSRPIRRNLQDPFVWLRSPGTIIFGVASKWMLEDNAKARKQKKRKGQVIRIRCAHYENDPFIYFWVTDPNDGHGYDVKLVKGVDQVNIADWLLEEGIAPAPGISQKFDLVAAEEEMLGGPVLCINTDQAQKTKHFDTSGKKADEEDDTDDES